MRILLPILFVVSFVTYGQRYNFDQYKGLKSAGEIPSDFTLATSKKMNQDVTNKRTAMSEKQERLFFESTNFAIDELLHSGMIVYNDPISSYASSIVDRLLVNDPELRKELRVYTFKSNMTNAFSTDQGMIFVTTGLISQLTSEAELAYILAHEISHFTEKHVVETYEWRISTDNTYDKYREFGHYAKDKEFEADRLGVKMFHDAGYANSAAISTFDVLMYSYLPWDEVELPNDYFNTPQLHIPSEQFSVTYSPITAQEDYDDSRSSHPNIKRRKKKIEDESETHKNWGDTLYYLGRSQFEYVQTISRFESVRLDIIDNDPKKALYSIFLLERDYPESTYLKEMKAVAWYNLLKSKRSSKINIYGDWEQSNTPEGQYAKMYKFLTNQSNKALKTIALRTLYDLNKELPENATISNAYKKLVYTLAGDDDFNPEDYHTSNYFVAKDSADIIINSEQMDSLLQTIDSTSMDKYARIKIDMQRSKDEVHVFNPNKYYQYAISDIIQDQAFIDDYKLQKSRYQDDQDKEQSGFMWIFRDFIDESYDAEGLLTDSKKLLVIDPTVLCIKKGRVDTEKSEKANEVFTEAIKSGAKSNGVIITTVDRDYLRTSGTEAFNDRNALLDLLNQVTHTKADVLPVDIETLESIKNRFRTEHIMFTVARNYNSTDMNPWGVTAGAILVPPFTIGGFIPYRILNRHLTELDVIIIDLNTGEVKYEYSEYYSEKLTETSLGAHTYELFHYLTR